MKILQEEERHLTLLVAYEEITRDCQKMTKRARSAACGEIMSVYAAPTCMYTMVASYQEPLEILEEILINKQNTEIF